MYNRNDNAYGDDRRRWNVDDHYKTSSRYQDTGNSSGLRGNEYQSRQSLMSANYDDIHPYNANTGRVTLLEESETRRQETFDRRSDSYRSGGQYGGFREKESDMRRPEAFDRRSESYGSGGQYGGFKERGDRSRKSLYDEGPFQRQETERYPPRREEPLRGRGLLGEQPEQQFLQPQPNVARQIESEAKLALANTLINALVQSQQPVLSAPAPLMAQPLMNAPFFGGPVRGRHDEPRYRRDEARGPGHKMARKEFGDRRRDEKPYDRKKNVPAKQTPSRGKAGDKENGKKDKTPSKGAHQGKDEEDNTPYKGLPKRYFFCHLCYKEVWNGPSFERHLKGAMHNDVLKRTEEVHNARIESLRLLSQLQEEKREKYSDRNYISGATQHCNMCDAEFTGSLFRHRKSKTHLSLKAFIHPKCYMCNEDFHSRIDRDEHFLTAKHLKKLYEFEGDDLVPKLPQEAEKEEAEVVKVEEYDPANPTEEEESKSDQTKVKEGKTLPKLVPKGRTIYHCNVCNLYFSHVEMVYDRHCRTEGHHDHYGYAIAVRNDIKVDGEEEDEEEKGEKEKTAEKKEGDDDGSDDDGNWKRRGAKKRDETDNDESLSQVEKEEMESSRKRDRTDSEKEEEESNSKMQEVEMKEDIPGVETTIMKEEKMDTIEKKEADSEKEEEGLSQKAKAKEDISAMEVTDKQKPGKEGPMDEAASDLGIQIAEEEAETPQPQVEEKAESKEEKTSKSVAAKPKPGPKTSKNFPVAKGAVKTPAKAAPSVGTKRPGPLSKTVQPPSKKAAIVNKPVPATAKGAKKGAAATPQAANGAAKGKGAPS